MVLVAAYAAANATLEAEFMAKHPVSPEALEALGKARAQSIQEALLGGGEVDPGRVFLITAEPKPPDPVATKVKLELSLK